MLEGVNGRAGPRERAGEAAEDHSQQVNLIPFNPFPDSGFKRTAMDRVKRFSASSSTRAMSRTIRRTRGDDIDAACGQLAGQVVKPHEGEARPHPRSART